MGSTFARSVALASGLCALVYEVVWMRLFTPVFGLSVYASTAVLCAFMGGLGLGSHLAPRILAAWRRSPWLLYAGLELGIGLGALALPAAIAPITQAYVAASGLDAAGLFTGLVRFSLSFAAMAVPTFFMGVTLPALAHACRHDFGEEPLRAERIGVLYGLNTLGGAIGCLLVGFLLLPALGTRTTVAATAAVNGIVAVLAATRAARGGTGRAPEPAPTGTRAAAPPTPAPDVEAVPSATFLLGVYAAVGAISFGFELSWFRILIFYLQSAAHSFSLMLTLFLLGVGLGSLLYSRWLEPRLAGPRDAAAALAVAQLGIAACGALTLPVYAGLPGVWELLLAWLGAGSWQVIVFQKAIVSSLVILPPTLLMGLSFPLLARLYKARGATDARALARLYAANTFGALAGSLATGFLLFDAIGVQATLTLLSLASVATGLAFGGRALARSRPRLALAGGLVALVLAVQAATPQRMLLANFERYQGAISFYREAAADITFVYEVEGDLWLGFSDGRGTSSTSAENDYLNRMSAYEAMVLRPDARNVLVISMGCGNTASAFTAFPIERLDIVDISSGPFEAAGLFHTNRSVLDDPRVHVTVEDGRNFLLKTPRKYDVIELELPSLHTDGVAFLYTREFYEIARAHLTEGGVISQWIDAFQTRRQPSYRLVSTMREVFPEVSVWANRWSWWILGVNGGPPGAPDYERVRAVFETASVREDMARVGTDLEDILASLVGYGEALDRALGSAAPITDDRTWIDFELPKLPTPGSLGGGVAYYNAPLRKLFEEQWKSRGGIRQAGLVPFHGGGAERHDDLVDRSLREFARGYPAALLERVAARNGGW